MSKYLQICFLRIHFLAFALMLMFILLFTIELNAQRVHNKNHIYLNSTISIPLIYNDRSFQSSIPIFLTGEFKLNNFSFTLGLGVEFGKLEQKNQSEAITLSRCPPILVSDTNREIIRCYHCITRNSINLRFPIAFNYYFLKKKKLQTYFSSGIILDYSFSDHGSISFFEYSTSQMKLLSNELKQENFRYNDFYYINYDVMLQLGGKYALAERWFLNLGVQYSRSFEKFSFRYINNDGKLFVFSGMSFLLSRS